MLVTATHTAETTSPDDSVPSRAELVSSNAGTQETPKCTADVHVSAIAGEDEEKEKADSATVTLPEVTTPERLLCVGAPSSASEPPKPPAVLKAKLSVSAPTDATSAERSRPTVGPTPAASSPSSVSDARTKTIIVVDLGSDDDIKPPTTTKATTSVAGKKTHKNPSDLLQSKQKQQIGISKGVKRPASSDSTRQLSTAATDGKRPASGADGRKRLEGEGGAAAGLRRPVENEKTESSSSRGVVGNTSAGSLKQTEKLVKVR